jgi:hypothetical protein
MRLILLSFHWTYGVKNYTTCVVFLLGRGNDWPFRDYFSNDAACR